ncbi:MAG TPA: 4-hydroxyphenylacetate 3-hydroxylase N-terminal domain-containing protein [Chloroflexota bacterium]|jgi:4-hydroxyphenylacetate 3-monooxygenase
MRVGRQYLESLGDGRTVYVDGERVGDVGAHPAFRGVTRTVATLYDYAADPANGMAYTAPETGGPANKAFMVPRSRDDLRQRREAIAAWATLSHGLLGRGPDHVAGFFAGFAGGAEVFARGRAAFADNVTRWYRRLLDEDLYFTYVIIPPQVDRSKTAQGQEEAFLQVGVCREADGGIVVRGAQMLGTGAAVANHLFVSCIVPQRPGDEDYALSFILALGSPGLKLYCRQPYAVGKPSVYDYPLSTRFDETDALVVFDDVLVPWENVFVYRDVVLTRAQFFDTAAHALGNTQAQIRLAAKLKFLIGVARKIAATNRIDELPQVQEKLGDLGSIAAIVEGMVLAAEATCQVDRFGVAVPNRRFLYAPMGLQAELYPRAVQLLRELAGGGVIQVPSSYKELVEPETRDDVRRYVRSTGVPSEERVKLFKLAWDLVGSEFGGRHSQYEMFYAGAPYVAKGYAYRNYGYDEPLGLVDAFLAGYGLETPAPAAEQEG